MTFAPPPTISHCTFLITGIKAKIVLTNNARKKMKSAKKKCCWVTEHNLQTPHQSSSVLKCIIGKLLFLVKSSIDEITTKIQLLNNSIN